MCKVIKNFFKWEKHEYKQDRIKKAPGGKFLELCEYLKIWT